MPKHFLYIFGGAIGDALLGVHLGRILVANFPDARLRIISTRKNKFVREILESLPFISYEEMPRNCLSSWIRLITLLRVPHAVAYWSPFRDSISLWWRIIAHMATFRSGSIEVRCQINTNKCKTSSRMRFVNYDCRTDNLFTTVEWILSAWDIQITRRFGPYLEKPINCTQIKSPFILFHFFAGSHRRSFPVGKVKLLLIEAREKFPKHEFVLTCGPQEEASARKMVEDISNAQVEVNPSARKLLCLLQQSKMCVGVASGITHIASHLDVPSVVLCNLSDPCWLPSYAKNSVLLYERSNCGCHGDKTGECWIKTVDGVVYRCLYDITIGRIIEEMSKKLFP